MANLDLWWSQCLLLENTTTTLAKTIANFLLFLPSYCLSMQNNTIKSNAALHRGTQTHWLHVLIRHLCWVRTAKSHFLLALGPFRTVPTDWVDTEQIKLQRQQAEERVICQKWVKYNPQLHGMQNEFWSLLRKDVCLVTKGFQRHLARRGVNLCPIA